jgi:hypothetical protein
MSSGLDSRPFFETLKRANSLTHPLILYTQVTESKVTIQDSRLVHANFEDEGEREAAIGGSLLAGLYENLHRPKFSPTRVLFLSRSRFNP